MTKTQAFPPDWFDLDRDTYADFGAMFYLAGLTSTHQKRLLFQAVYLFETPLRLGQYHIFRQNGFPRAFVTFAGLSKDAEYRYAIEGEPLMAEDFTSGSSFWIIDFVAPFGQVPKLVSMLKESIPHPRVRTNRLDSDMSHPRIVEWTRDDGGKVHARMIRKKDFARQLEQEAD